MRFTLKGALLAIPMLAFATQAHAALPAGLADTTQPGSVIIFPKFINQGQVTVDGNTVSRTEIEIGAVCPPLAQFARNLVGCMEHAPVKVRFHWVCPGAEGFDSNICRETDFDVVLSINGKLAFSTDGIQINSNSPVVPVPQCPRGYLIGWVIRASDDAPIKYDALIGNAVIRGPNVASSGTSTAVSAYAAITIQANDADPVSQDTATAAVLGVPNSSGPAVFTQANSSGTYKTITGVQVGDVRFDKTVAGAPTPNVLSETFLIFLTLDVLSNQPNNPVMVDLDFWNESDAAGSLTNPNFERLLSSFTTFLCWQQAGLTADSNQTLGNGAVVDVPPIDPNLNQGFMATRKGIVLAGPATKIPDGGAPGDSIGPVTLIGLVETIEGTVADGFQNRKYNFNMSSDGFAVDTRFVPNVTAGSP
jgi:hypothetical protein